MIHPLHEPNRNTDEAAKWDELPTLGMLQPILPPLPILGCQWMEFPLWIISRQLQSGAIATFAEFGNIFQFWNVNFSERGLDADVNALFWQFLSADSTDGTVSQSIGKSNSALHPGSNDPEDLPVAKTSDGSFRESVHLDPSTELPDLPDLEVQSDSEPISSDIEAFDASSLEHFQSESPDDALVEHRDVHSGAGAIATPLPESGKHGQSVSFKPEASIPPAVNEVDRANAASDSVIEVPQPEDDVSLELSPIQPSSLSLDGLEESVSPQPLEQASGESIEPSDASLSDLSEPAPEEGNTSLANTLSPGEFNLHLAQPDSVTSEENEDVESESQIVQEQGQEDSSTSQPGNDQSEVYPSPHRSDLTTERIAPFPSVLQSNQGIAEEESLDVHEESVINQNLTELRVNLASDESITPPDSDLSSTKDDERLSEGATQESLLGEPDLNPVIEPIEQPEQIHLEFPEDRGIAESQQIQMSESEQFSSTPVIHESDQESSVELYPVNVSDQGTALQPLDHVMEKQTEQTVQATDANIANSEQAPDGSGQPSLRESPIPDRESPIPDNNDASAPASAEVSPQNWLQRGVNWVKSQFERSAEPPSPEKSLSQDQGAPELDGAGLSREHDSENLGKRFLENPSEKAATTYPDEPTQIFLTPPDDTRQQNRENAEASILSSQDSNFLADSDSSSDSLKTDSEPEQAILQAQPHERLNASIEDEETSSGNSLHPAQANSVAAETSENIDFQEPIIVTHDQQQSEISAEISEQQHISAERIEETDNSPNLDTPEDTPEQALVFEPPITIPQGSIEESAALVREPGDELTVLQVVDELRDSGGEESPVSLPSDAQNGQIFEYEEQHAEDLYPGNEVSSLTDTAQSEPILSGDLNSEPSSPSGEIVGQPEVVSPAGRQNTQPEDDAIAADSVISYQTAASESSITTPADASTPAIESHSSSANTLYQASEETLSHGDIISPQSLSSEHSSVEITRSTDNTVVSPAEAEVGSSFDVSFDVSVDERRRSEDDFSVSSGTDEAAAVVQDEAIAAQSDETSQIPLNIGFAEQIEIQPSNHLPSEFIDSSPAPQPQEQRIVEQFLPEGSVAEPPETIEEHSRYPVQQDDRLPEDLHNTDVADLPDSLNPRDQHGQPDPSVEVSMEPEPTVVSEASHPAHEGTEPLPDSFDFDNQDHSDISSPRPPIEEATSLQVEPPILQSGTPPYLEPLNRQEVEVQGGLDVQDEFNSETQPPETQPNQADHQQEIPGTSSAVGDDPESELHGLETSAASAENAETVSSRESAPINSPSEDVAKSVSASTEEPIITPMGQIIEHLQAFETTDAIETNHSALTESDLIDEKESVQEESIHRAQDDPESNGESSPLENVEPSIEQNIPAFTDPISSIQDQDSEVLEDEGISPIQDELPANASENRPSSQGGESATFPQNETVLADHSDVALPRTVNEDVPIDTGSELNALESVRAEIIEPSIILEPSILLETPLHNTDLEGIGEDTVQSQDGIEQVAPFEQTPDTGAVPKEDAVPPLEPSIVETSDASSVDTSPEQSISRQFHDPEQFSGIEESRLQEQAIADGVSVYPEPQLDEATFVQPAHELSESSSTQQQQEEREPSLSSQSLAQSSDPVDNSPAPGESILEKPIAHLQDNSALSDFNEVDSSAETHQLAIQQTELADSKAFVQERADRLEDASSAANQGELDDSEMTESANVSSDSPLSQVSLDPVTFLQEETAPKTERSDVASLQNAFNADIPVDNIGSEPEQFSTPIPSETVESIEPSIIHESPARGSESGSPRDLAEAEYSANHHREQANSAEQTSNSDAFLNGDDMSSEASSNLEEAHGVDDDVLGEKISSVETPIEQPSIESRDLEQASVVPHEPTLIQSVDELSEITSEQAENNFSVSQAAVRPVPVTDSEENIVSEVQYPLSIQTDSANGRQADNLKTADTFQENDQDVLHQETLLRRDEQDDSLPESPSSALDVESPTLPMERTAEPEMETPETSQTSSPDAPVEPALSADKLSGEEHTAEITTPTASFPDELTTLSSPSEFGTQFNTRELAQESFAKEASVKTDSSLIAADPSNTVQSTSPIHQEYVNEVPEELPNLQLQQSEHDHELAITSDTDGTQLVQKGNEEDDNIPEFSPQDPLLEANSAILSPPTEPLERPVDSSFPRENETGKWIKNTSQQELSPENMLASEGASSTEVHGAKPLETTPGLEQDELSSHLISPQVPLAFQDSDIYTSEEGGNSTTEATGSPPSAAVPDRWDSLEELMGANLPSLGFRGLQLSSVVSGYQNVQSWSSLEELLNPEIGGNQPNTEAFDDSNTQSNVRPHSWDSLTKVIHSLSKPQDISDDLLSQGFVKTENSIQQNITSSNRAETFTTEIHHYYPSRQEFIQSITNQIQLGDGYEYEDLAALRKFESDDDESRINSRLRNSYLESALMPLIHEAYDKICMSQSLEDANLIFADTIERLSEFNRSAKREAENFMSRTRRVDTFDIY
jgi:hypothetical protein